MQWTVRAMLFLCGGSIKGLTLASFAKGFFERARLRTYLFVKRHAEKVAA